jgi:hypothetical protein
MKYFNNEKMEFETLKTDSTYEIAINDSQYVIRRRDNQRIISQYTREDGYVTVYLNCEKYLLHRVIALQFIPNPENLPVVNHKNHIRNDNRIENLEWVTVTQNLQDQGFSRNGKIVIIDEFEFWEAHPNAIQVTHVRDFEFDNFYFDSEELRFYNYVEWNGTFRKCNISFNNGRRYVRAKDIHGAWRSISVNSFLKSLEK